jgi:uncharacterized protein YdaU (DUF1376 family)
MTAHSSAGDGRIDHFLPLYVRDFLTSTIGWTAEERGHYLMLLMISWDRGGLPADLPGLERISPGVTACWRIIEPKFTVCGDGLRRNFRLESHRIKAKEMREKRSAAGAIGGQARAKQLLGKGSANGQANAKQTLSKRQANGMAPFEQDSGNEPTSPGDQSDNLANQQETSAEIQRGAPIPPISQANAKQSSSKRLAIAKQPEPEPHREEKKSGGGDFPALGNGPLPAPSAASHRGSIDAGAWARLLQAWNAGEGAAWPSKRPPPEAVAALSDPEWLPVAFAAIEHLPRCRYFRSPPDLSQFCAEGFAAKVASGKYDHRFDEKAGPTPGEEAARARKDAEAAKRVDEFVRIKDEKRRARLEELAHGGE